MQGMELLEAGPKSSACCSCNCNLDPGLDGSDHGGKPVFSIPKLTPCQLLIKTIDLKIIDLWFYHCSRCCFTHQRYLV